MLILGLGNPGKQYKNTRHNIGFTILDQIKQSHEDFSDFSVKKKLEAEISNNCHPELFSGSSYKRTCLKNGIPKQVRDDILLAKPLTFMNESGRAAKKIKEYYKLKPSQIIVIQDDSDLAMGKIRIKKGGQGAGHKGIESINKHIKSNSIIRILFGIRDPEQDATKQAEQFVLKPFPKSKLPLIQEKIKKAAKAAIFLTKTGKINKAQAMFNG